MKFNEPGPSISEKTSEKILDFIINLDFSSTDWILFCGSLPPGMQLNFYKKAIERIRSKNTGIKIGIDADGQYLKYGICAKPDLIKPNIKELERLVSRKITGFDQLMGAGERFLRSGISFILVTMGEKGAVGFSKEGVFYTKGPQIKKAGSVGCGDVFLAGFILSFSETGNFKESLKFATAAGTAKAAKSFTDIPEPKEVKKFLKKILIWNLDDPDGKTKKLSLQEVPVIEST